MVRRKYPIVLIYQWLLFLQSLARTYGFPLKYLLCRRFFFDKLSDSLLVLSRIQGAGQINEQTAGRKGAELGRQDALLQRGELGQVAGTAVNFDVRAAGQGAEPGTGRID